MKFSLSLSLQFFNNLEWWHAQKGHKGVLLVNRQEPFLDHSSNKEIISLCPPSWNIKMNSDSLQRRGEILKEEYGQENFSRNRAPGRKDRHRKANRRGCQVFTSLIFSSQISHLKKKALSAYLQRSIKLEIYLLFILFGEPSTLNTAPKLSVLGGPSMGTAPPPLPSQSPVTLHIISVQRAVLHHILKLKKSKQTETKGLKCKLNPKSLSQALLCSELIPLFLTCPEVKLPKNLLKLED